ncbi:type II toxin-antitoxin system HicA family toxin [Persephonella sp.]
MSKIPRDVNGKDLSKKLKKYGYTITRQTGSHIRLSSNYMGYEHHITIPEHNPLKVGTLNAILVEISSYLKIDKKKLINELFK